MDDFSSHRRAMAESAADESEISERHFRKGGPQAQDETDEEKQKREERERKKQEVRERLMAQSAVKKAKKGFLTPERKKKLRKLLMLKAAEDLKQQQLMKEEERRRILQDRILPLPDIDSMDEGDLVSLAEKFQDRIAEVEETKYDLESAVRQKDFEINELSIAVNDLRGKFVKPALKKVSVSDNKFAKMAAQTKKTTDANFRDKLKQVDSKKFTLDDVKEEEKAEWAKK